MPGPKRNQSSYAQLSDASEMLADARRMRREAAENLRTVKAILEEELQKVTEELGQIEE